MPLPTGTAAGVSAIAPRKLPSRGASRSGMTLVELSFAMTITLTALTLLGATIASASRTRSFNRENALAARAARNVLEQMNDADFFDLFALYNADPTDDPDGVGTAPGDTFDVPELTPRPGDDAVGSIRFPTVDVAGLPAVRQLREDVQDRNLGMPRDLNLDGKIDELDHASDYSALPILVEVRWTGSTGERSLRLYTQLAELRL